jgi:hypothetical protein
MILGISGVLCKWNIGIMERGIDILLLIIHDARFGN